VDPVTVRDVVAQGRDADIVVCRYTDGIGHPFWFRSNIFGELCQLHGDKGVWKLIESGRYPVRELAIAGAVPLDVDTWDDYQRLLETAPS
jgi:molybdenum cofactor cytidylyltransferase